MGLGKFFKKLFKAIAPVLPLFFLFSPTSFTSNLFGFGKGAGSEFIKKNLMKGLIWGYGIYKALNPPKPPTYAGAGDFAEEPVYSWDGGQLTSQSNIPVPVVCGEWFVDVGNVIDRELSNTSVNILNPKATSLYMRRDDMRYNSELVAANLINQVQIIGIETVEQGNYAGLILGYNQANHRYVYFSTTSPSTGWQEFVIHGLNYGLHSEYFNNVSATPGVDQKHVARGHKKFVFVPDTDSVYAFLHYYDAGSYMIKLDLTTKIMYLYRPYSIFVHVDDDPIHRIFDWAYYKTITTPYGGLIDANNNDCGFGRTYNEPERINNPIALRNYAYHYANEVMKFNSADPDDFTYLNNYMEYNEDWAFHYYKKTVVAPVMDRLYGTLSGTHIMNNKPTLKIMDGIIHYHKTYNDFSMQILVESDADPFRKYSYTVNNPPSGTISGRPVPFSNSKNRFMIGLTRVKYDTIYLETDDPYLSDISTVWNDPINGEQPYIRAAITNKEFYGLFGQFENYSGTTNFDYGEGTGPYNLKPTAKQTEIYNLAYMVLDGDGPCPSVFFHNIHYDKSIRIEYLAKQPQFKSWYEQDSSGRNQVNKSIGAIVSYIIHSVPNDTTKELSPSHISHGYFSALCTSDNEPNKRFDPFFIEIANFSFLTDAVANTGTSNGAVDAVLMNVKETSDGMYIKPSSIKNFKNTGNLNWQARSVTKLYYYSNDGRTSSAWNTYTYSPDDRMDDYLLDYATTTAFYNYNQSLMATELIYVPEHEYHLVKIENTWVPIRGWSKYYVWRVQDIPVAVYPTESETLTKYYSDYSFEEHYGWDLVSKVADGGYTAHNTDPYQNSPYTHNKMTEYGYTVDKDGQLLGGQPFILNGKLYWLGQNYFYMNVDDYQNNFNFPEEFVQESPNAFIEIGWWNEMTPSEASGGLTHDRTLWNIPGNITGFTNKRQIKYAPIKKGYSESNISIT